MVLCEGCGNELEVDPVESPEVDWVKVVCSGCGEVNDVSIVRILEEASV